MSLNTVTTGNTILAGDINQLVNVLQRAAGQTETGGYYITGNGSNTASLGTWVSSLSRTSSPASVSLDTSMQSPANCNNPSNDHLTANGVHIFTSTTSTTLGANVGGLYTIQY